MKKIVDEAVALLRKMVAIPSESFAEAEVADLIAGTLESWGIKVTMVGRNILCYNKFYDSSLPTLALDAHIDTVPASASWTRNPLDPGTEDDTVYGLGANDDGGSVVAMAAAFRYLYERKMPLNIVLTLSCEEEKSGPDGARFIYSPEGPFRAGEPKWAIVGEPTGMRAATSERGLLVLDGKAVGVSGHAARNEGVNALYIALDDISRLRGHSFRKVSPVMGEVRLNVTQINAGTAHNVIPDNCSFTVDIRPTDVYTNEEILEELQAECQSTLVPRNLANRSSATAPDSLLLKAAALCGMETFSSPTTSNWMRMGCDAVKMGPGDSARSHKADEFIKCGEIEEAVEKYIEFIENLYGNIVE